MRRHEIAGDLEEILGYGAGGYGEEELGAALAPRNLVTLPSGTRVVTRQLSKARDQILPISSIGTVAASTQVSLVNRPQAIFRPERFVAGDITNFTIQDIKVGMSSQFLGQGSVPSAVFGPTAVGVRLKADTATVAMDVSVLLTNIDAANAHAFSGALIGPSVS